MSINTIRGFYPVVGLPSLEPDFGSSALKPLDFYISWPSPQDEVGQVTGGGGTDSVRNHLVLTAPDEKGVKTMQTVVDLSEVDAAKLPTTADFERVILDGNNYPLDATYIRLKVLETCQSIGSEDGYTLVYQKIPGALGTSPRQYIIAMSRVKYSEDYVKVEWKSVEEQYARSNFGKHLEQGDIIYPPYNTGYWIYDRRGRTITYSVSTDPGGRVPKPTDGMLKAFPLRLLEKKWGVSP